MNIIIVIIVSIISSFLTVLACLTTLGLNKKECEHIWTNLSTENIYDPFYFNRIKSKKIILKCKKCGEIKTKTIF